MSPRRPDTVGEWGCGVGAGSVGWPAPLEAGHVAPPAAPRPARPPRDRPPRAGSVSGRQSLPPPSRPARGRLHGRRLRRPLPGARPAGLRALAARAGHVAAVPRGGEGPAGRPGGAGDRRAAEAVRGRIDWKYLLSLELGDAGFDHGVLCEFRGRLLAADAGERRLLARVLD